MSRTYKKDNILYEGMSKFKKLRKKKRKAKEKQAVKDHDYENIPKFKNSDKYDFL